MTEPARPFRLNLVDRAIGVFAPGAALRRGAARFALEASIGGAGGYDGARHDKASLRNWWRRPMSADAAFLPAANSLRGRSEDLGRNSPLAVGAQKTLTTATIGGGLRLKSTIDRDFLGLDDDIADALERAFERNWKMWAESVEADFSRRLPFEGEQESVTLRAVLAAGDMFTILRFLERPGSLFGLKTQMIAGERVSNPNFRPDGARLPNGRKCVGGIELDRNGAPLAIWYSQHPGDIYPGAMTWQRVPIFARVTGMRQVLHHFEAFDVDQTRGVPFLAPVIEPLKQLTRYSEYELAAAVTAAMFTVFVKTEGARPLGGVTSPVSGTGAGASGEKRTLELAPGLVTTLQPGESIETANPGRPNANFDPFTTAMCREIGAGLEIPYEVLVKHYQSSYTAARGAFLDLHRVVKTKRKWQVRSQHKPLYEAVSAEGVARGFIPAPGFFQDPMIRRAYLGSEWIGEPAGQIDEVKEINSALARIYGGVSTLEEETARITGGDWERNHPQRVKEHTARTEAGLEVTPPGFAFAPDGGAPQEETQNAA